MKRSRSIIFVILLTLIVSALALASDKGIVKIQGIIMEVDLRRNVMIVNEKRLVWDLKTIICNESGAITTMDQLKINRWVYIEGMDDKANRRVLAQKIYLIPNPDLKRKSF